MRQVTLKLDAVKVKSFDPRTGSAALQIWYSKNNQQRCFDVHHNITTRSEVITNDIIKAIKAKGTVEIDNDDILEAVYVKKFLNEEKAEERLLLFFARLYERGKMIAHEKNHVRYMQLLDEIQHQQMVV